MTLELGPRWVVLPDTLRFTPNYVPTILMQIESSGLNDTTQYNNQTIVINNTTVVNLNTPRSYRVTRLVYNNGWTLASANSYDVYGSVLEANNLLAYLQTFNTRDMLVLSTQDEPFTNKTIFQSELINNFSATLQTSPLWGGRCSYQLIAVKGKGAIYENIKAVSSSTGINTTLMLGRYA